MLKRLARAIENPEGHQGFEPHPESIMKALQVVKALRVPTHYMLESAGVMNGYENPGRPYSVGVDADHIDWWINMIDAIQSQYDQPILDISLEDETER